MLLSNFIINYVIFDNGISQNESLNRELLYNNKIIYSVLLILSSLYINVNIL